MNKKEIENWKKFINEIANEDVSDEELREDLTAAGYDVDALVEDIQKTVHQCYREASQRIAEQGIKEKNAQLDRIARSLKGMSRDEMVQNIIDLAERGNKEALVFCREVNGNDISDEEIECLLVDIIANGGEENAD